MMTSPEGKIDLEKEKILIGKILTKCKRNSGLELVMMITQKKKTGSNLKIELLKSSKNQSYPLNLLICKIVSKNNV